MTLQKRYFFSLVMIAAPLFGTLSDHGCSKGHSHLKHTDLGYKTTYFTPQQWRAVKVVGGLVGTAAVHYASDSIVGDGMGKRFYNGQYAWGYAQTLKLSGAFLSVAPMLGDEWGEAFFRFGMRAPIIAGSAIIVAHPVSQKLASYAMLGLGDHLSTWDKTKDQSKCGADCKGICTRCFLPKTVLIVGLYKTLDPFFDKIGRAAGEYVGLIKPEDEESQQQ